MFAGRAGILVLRPGCPPTAFAGTAALTSEVDLSRRPADPLLVSARREAVVSLAVFAAALAYTVGYCCRFAYGRPATEIRYYAGIPDWVLWGIVAPWIVCLAVTVWFSLGFMRDEPLEPDGQVADHDPGLWEESRDA